MTLLPSFAALGIILSSTWAAHAKRVPYAVAIAGASLAFFWALYHATDWLIWFHYTYINGATQ